MGKSLTEAARAILMKEATGGYPSVDPMGAGHPDRDANASNPNLASLHPKSKGSDEKPIVNPNSNPPNASDYEDTGPAPVKATDVPGSAKVAGKVAKDTTKSSQSAVGSEPFGSVKKSPTATVSMAEEMEDEGEVVKEALVKKSKDLAKKMKDLKEAKKKEKEEMEESWSKKKMEEAKEKEVEEDVEISEELEAFVNEMIEQGYSEEEIAEAVNENFEIVEAEEKEEEPGEKKHHEGKKEKEEMEESSHEDDKDMKKKELEERSACMKEHVDALLAGENLSEEFRTKAQTIFESAVSQRVNEELDTIEQAYAQSLEEEVQKIYETLTEQVDDYLNYVVEQWVSENEVAIESGLRSELTEDFISGLRNLFAEHYIDIPEAKVDMVETLGEKIEELETKLNEEIDRNVKLTKTINESKQFEVLVQACEGLTTTQAEKLKTLAENVEFTSTKEYAQKISTLRESYFPTTVNSDKVLDTAESTNDGKGMISEDLRGPMASYVRTLGKSLPK